tara:strand:+ start:3787 stop:3990 length:204 start_codon:yes stop_codon:yes gene_type:complete
MKRNNELEQLMIEMTEEAISVRLDYETSGSNLDSGSMIQIHQDSPLLKDEKEKLTDVVFNIERKKNE